jgi:hypothetical protein
MSDRQHRVAGIRLGGVPAESLRWQAAGDIKSCLASAINFPADTAEAKWGHLREVNLNWIPEGPTAMEAAK